MNISGRLSDLPVAPTPAPAPGSRRALADDVLDELTSWQSRMRMAMFQSWARDTLSLVHLSVLAALEANGPLSMTRLAETMGVSVASATGIVTRMERRGVVRRRHDEDDRRVVLVEITEGGAKVSHVMETFRRRRLARLLDRLTEQELSSFLLGLRALGAVRMSEPPDTDEDTDDEAAAEETRR